mmetsp:Transcript_10475/g.24255  ORF Transcript_10475/g.24255 Transcript_10475/m.24255 type:complete len:557 (-) Transcript_10475:392-2062(-)
MRLRAHAVLSRHVKVRAHIMQEADRFWEGLAAFGVPVLGVHVRGTDKQEWIGGRVVPPAEYVPHIERYLAKSPSAILFVATDSPAFLSWLQQKYAGRIYAQNALRSERNAFLDMDLTDHYRKGADVLIDALLLSRCHFLLKCSSAVGEYAIYFNVSLHNNSIDVQYAHHSSERPRAPSLSHELRAAEPPAYAPRAAPRVAANSAAVCLHGRAAAMEYTAHSLLEHLVTPLRADLYVHALPLCSRDSGTAGEPLGEGRCAPPAAQLERWLAQLNATGRLVHAGYAVDDAALGVRMRRELNASSLRRRVITAEKTYLDMTNARHCLRLMLQTRPERSQPYAIMVHCRLDVLLFGPPPAALLSAIARTARAAQEQRLLWVPLGDDFGGIVDWMAIASREGALVLEGTRGNMTATGQGALLPIVPMLRRAYPEHVTKAQIERYEARLVRFTLAACRISSQGVCRYPGEVSRLLNISGGAHARAHRSVVCGDIWVRSKQRGARCCVTSPASCAGQPEWRTWRGMSSCAKDWGDPSCCGLLGRCNSLAGPRVLPPQSSILQY